MSEMRYRRHLRDMAAMAPQMPYQQRLMQAMLGSQLPVQTQLAWLLHRDDLEVLECAIFVTVYLEISALAPRVVQILETYTDETRKNDWLMRIGHLEHADVDNLLLTTIQSSTSLHQRIVALVALRDGKHPDTVAPLLAIAQNEMEPMELRGNALETLAYQGDEALLPHILPFLQDADPTFRWDALYTVGHLGNLSYASYIVPLLTDPYRVYANSPSIGENAHEILERWTTCIRIEGITWQIRFGVHDE